MADDLKIPKIIRSTNERELPIRRAPRITIEFDYSVGDKVRIAPIGAAGLVLSLWFSDRGVKYQVAWWDNAVRHEEYLLPAELEPWKE